MKKGTIAKKFLATLIVCCGILGARPANAFVWPCIDITQISAFVSSITTNLSTVTNAFTQIKNMEATIASVGSQISSMKDFMSDLRKTIESIKEAVENVTTSVKKAIDETKESIKDAKNIVEDANNNQEDKADATVYSVENAIDGNAKEDALQDILNESKQEAEIIKNEVLETYDEALKSLNQILDDANTSIEMLVNAVNTNENLSENQKQDLNNKADSIKENISSLKNDANAVLNDIKSRYSEEYAKKIATAYDNYSQAISDYFDGKISKDELKKKGEEFKNSISSIDTSINNSLIDKFAAKANDIANRIDELEEDIINTFSNDKEYSDDDGDEEKKASLFINTPKKYAFTYSTTSPITLAKSVYMNDIDGKPFLISKEFLCKNKGISDIEKLKEKSDWFRTCVSRAKTELTYYPDAADDSLYTKYQRNGVYNHISHDYNVANLVTISKMKMFSESWLGVVGKEEDSERYKLKKRVSEGDVDNQASGVATLSLIELWSPRIWSNIKVTDAIGRARSTVKQFEYDDTLHIDNVNGRNPEVAAALDAKPGVHKVGDVDKKVFPNVMLHICGLKAKDVSLDSSESDEGIQLEKEEKIKSCIEKFAKGASKGTEDGEAGDVEEGKKIWRERQKMVTNDAAFESLTIGVINNFAATKDYRPSADLDDGELNIVKLQEVVKGGATTREHYGASAQINYYATQQLLNIIDADATDLQAEILKDMQTIDFSFFPEE